MKKNSDKKQKYAHFIGIGGIGISALAQWYLSEGWGVSGTDMVKSDVTEMLKNLGIKFLLQNSNFKFLISNEISNPKLQILKIIKNANLVVYSSAVSEDDWQIKYAKKLGKKVLSYPEALGELTKKYKTVCVSGTHGKSTTTAMLALIMIRAGIDPTVILGTKLKEFSPSRVRPYLEKNFRKGRSEWLLIEADEYKAAFLNYSPHMIVLTNIDKDHMDYYKDMSHILDVYSEYIKKLPQGGILIFNGDDGNIKSFTSQRPGRYNVRDVETAFSYKKQPKDRKRLEEVLKVHGKHNVYNALAALTAARALEIDDKISFEALAEFRGAWRRFEEIGNYKGAIVISDYAHNPEKIKALADALICRMETEKRQGDVTLVFQPHHQERLESLFDNFVKAFGDVASMFQVSGFNFQALITDVYEVAGREIKSKIQIKNSKLLVDAINKKYSDVNVIYIPKNKLKQWLENKFQVPMFCLRQKSGSRFLPRGGHRDFKFQVLCFAGAGDIDNIARNFLNHENGY